MLEIRIHTKEGNTYSASEYDIVLEHWQRFEPSEFLKNYLLRNLPVYCKDDGLEDEQRKILKAPDGKIIWQEGDTEAMCDGLRYRVIETTEEHLQPPEPFNPLHGLPAMVLRHIEKLQMQAYYEGYKAGVASQCSYEL